MKQNRALNASRYIPQMDPMVREVSEANRVYIFNVGPWSHVRAMGSAGTYLIPACLPDKPYSKPLIINGIENEVYPINETECAVLPKSGRPGQLRGDGSGLLFAQQLLGEGPMLDRRQSLRNFGVFISSTQVPSEEDLQAARLALAERRQALVAEANEIYLTDRNNAAKLITKEWHHKAAIDLGRTKEECPWLGDVILPAERKKCGGCGTPYEVGIAICPVCKNILDEEKAAEMFEREDRVRNRRPKKGKD
jgi:hypothetical protein